MGQTLKAHGAFRLLAEAHEYENANFGVLFCLPPFVVQLLIENYLVESYDASMQELQGHFQEHLFALLPLSIVKRAVLYDISSLCMFLGRQKMNDVLLSRMITYINSSRFNLTQRGPTLEASNENFDE